MTLTDQILLSSQAVLVVDWPSRDVPDTLALAGYRVTVAGGPDSYSEYLAIEGQVDVRKLGAAPDHVDLVYCHRPLAELARIADSGKQMGATAVWCQSGLDHSGARHPQGCWLPDHESRAARALVEALSLRYVDDLYIADEVRRLDIHKRTIAKP